MAFIFDFIKRRPVFVAIPLIFLIGVAAFAMHQVEGYPNISCAPCHIMGPYVEGYYSGELLAHKHAQADAKCIDCHENTISDKIEETWQYATGDFDDPPHKRIFDNTMCLKCHAVNDIKTATNYGQENPHDSHMGELACADCHKMHSKSKVACGECHNFDFMRKLSAEWEK